LPVKPYLLNYNDKNEFSLTTGATNQAIHAVLMMCFVFHPIVSMIDIPVIYPTDYMYEHHSEGVTNKTHVFANVTRKIMAEIGGLNLSDKSIKHNSEYGNLISENTSSNFEVNEKQN